MPAGGKGRQIGADGVVELHTPSFHELHYRRRGELLGDGADAIDAVRCRWHAVLEIGETVALTDECVGSANHDDGHSGRLVSYKEGIGKRVHDAANGDRIGATRTLRHRLLSANGQRREARREHYTKNRHEWADRSGLGIASAYIVARRIRPCP